MSFGKRTIVTDVARDQQPDDPRFQKFEYPWKHTKDFSASNFALGHLSVNIRARLTIDGLLHAETFVVALGAVAGFCAQCALHETMIKAGKVKLGKDYHIRVFSDGRKYLFGDVLNDFLISTAPGRLGLWSLVVGAAAREGVPVAELPDLGPIFSVVAESAGTFKFGLIDVRDEHKPHLQPLQALNLVWPLARKCLTGKGLDDRDYGQAAFEHWPVIANIVASNSISQMKEVLNPRVAARLIMQSAIIASKVQPTTVVGGQL